MIDSPTTLYDSAFEDDAAHAIVGILTPMGIKASAEYMGYGTPVHVDVVVDGIQYRYKFQGWGDEHGWYAGRDWLDEPNNMWEPDESEKAMIELPELAGVTDLNAIANAIRDAIVTRHGGG